MLAFYRDVRVVDRTDTVRTVIDELGDDGLPHVSFVRTPFQNLWIQWVSVMDLSLHMADAPDVVSESGTLPAAVQLGHPGTFDLADLDLTRELIRVGCAVAVNCPD